jgi:hypothetical protein
MARRKHQKECRHHRKHDGDRVGNAHRDEAVLTHQEVPSPLKRDHPIREPDRGRVDAAAEQVCLKQPNECLRTEYADKEIEQIEHHGEDGEAGEWLACKPRKPLLQPESRQGADAADPLGEGVSPLCLRER